jgi:hypothetical protein
MKDLIDTNEALEASPKEEKVVLNLGDKLRQKLYGTTPTKPESVKLSRAQRRALGIK